jgi:hypothetical protein
MLGVLEYHHRRGSKVLTLRACPPAKAEGAAHQLPVATDGEVLADLVMSPSQGVLYLLVALLDPASQSIESGHLREIGHGVLSSPSLLGIWSWQIAH